MPVAPGLDSTVKGWPSDLDRGSARIRAKTSTGPPGGKPWIRVIDRSGQASFARAGMTAKQDRPAMAARRVILGVVLVMVSVMADLRSCGVTAFVNS